MKYFIGFFFLLISCVCHGDQLDSNTISNPIAHVATEAPIVDTIEGAQQQGAAFILGNVNHNDSASNESSAQGQIDINAFDSFALALSLVYDACHLIGLILIMLAIITYRRYRRREFGVTLAQVFWRLGLGIVIFIVPMLRIGTVESSMSQVKNIEHAHMQVV